MENNDFDNIPEKFQESSTINNDPGPFATPPQNQYHQQPAQPEMTLKDWIITIILLFIPCVNIIMLIIWAVSNENKTRSNFAKAYLIVYVGVMILVGILYFAMFAAILGTMGSW